MSTRLTGTLMATTASSSQNSFFWRPRATRAWKNSVPTYTIAALTMRMRSTGAASLNSDPPSTSITSGANAMKNTSTGTVTTCST